MAITCTHLAKRFASRLGLLFSLVLIVAGCESDRQELVATNECVWCRLNGVDLRRADARKAVFDRAQPEWSESFLNPFMHVF